MLLAEDSTWLGAEAVFSSSHQVTDADAEDKGKALRNCDTAARMAQAVGRLSHSSTSPGHSDSLSCGEISAPPCHGAGGRTKSPTSSRTLQVLRLHQDGERKEGRTDTHRVRFHKAVNSLSFAFPQGDSAAQKGLLQRIQEQLS